MARLRRFPGDGSVADIAAALTDDGAVIVDHLLDPGCLGRFNAELDPFLARSDHSREESFMNPAVAAFYGTETRHVTGVPGKSHAFATEVMVHPAFLGVCDIVLRSSCADYQLNLAQVIDLGPGTEQQLWHRDEFNWLHLLEWAQAPNPHADVLVASIIALVDFTAENGATRVVPGSHRWERDRVPADHEVAVADMAAGSAVIYLGSTLHAGGGNATPDQRRRGMHLSYVVGWLRTTDNLYVTTPIEIVRALPRRSQELLGYRAHDGIAIGGGYVGMVDLRDPIELLAEGRL